MKEHEKRLQLHFLWSAAHRYALECPTLSRYLISRFSAVVGNGVSDGVRQRYCPACGSLFAPHTSSTRVYSRGRLRAHRRSTTHRSRAMAWLHRSLPAARRYVVLHCLVCRKSFASAASRKKGSDLAPSASGGVAASHSTSFNFGGVTIPHSCRTPVTHSATARRSRRRSSTLKGMVQVAAQLKQQRLQLISASPSLNDFLSS